MPNYTEGHPQVSDLGNWKDSAFEFEVPQHKKAEIYSEDSEDTILGLISLYLGMVAVIMDMIIRNKENICLSWFCRKEMRRCT